VFVLARSIAEYSQCLAFKGPAQRKAIAKSLMVYSLGQDEFNFLSGHNLLTFFSMGIFNVRHWVRILACATALR